MSPARSRSGKSTPAACLRYVLIPGATQSLQQGPTGRCAERPEHLVQAGRVSFRFVQSTITITAIRVSLLMMQLGLQTHTWLGGNSSFTPLIVDSTMTCLAHSFRRSFAVFGSTVRCSAAMQVGLWQRCEACCCWSSIFAMSSTLQMVSVQSVSAESMAPFVCDDYQPVSVLRGRLGLLLLLLLHSCPLLDDWCDLNIAILLRRCQNPVLIGALLTQRCDLRSS